MNSSLKVIRKLWSPSQTLPDTTIYYFENYTDAEKFFHKLLRRAKETSKRIYFVDLSLVENTKIREHRLLNPTVVSKAKYNSTIIKR